jgi:hypothetical protein
MVTTNMVWLKLQFIKDIKHKVTIFLSKLPVGSSPIITRGSLISAL